MIIYKELYYLLQLFLILKDFLYLWLYKRMIVSSKPRVVFERQINTLLNHYFRI